MKTFKQFIKNPVTSSNDTTSNVKPQYAFNSHGSHAKKPQYAFNSHGSHAKKSSDDKLTEWNLFEKSSEPAPIKDFLDSDLNGHLKGESHADKMEHLHELHPLTDVSKEHLKYYTNYSGDLNKALLDAKQNGTPVPDKISMHNIPGLDSSFTPAKTRLHTYSGIGFNPANVVHAGTSKAGNPVFQSPTFISSSHDPATARSFARDAQPAGEPVAHILHIETKPGQKIAAVGQHSMYSKENETLMPRDEHYERVGTSHYYDTNDDLHYTVHHVRRIPESEVIK